MNSSRKVVFYCWFEPLLMTCLIVVMFFPNNLIQACTRLDMFSRLRTYHCKGVNWSKSNSAAKKIGTPCCWVFSIFGPGDPVSDVEVGQVEAEESAPWCHQEFGDHHHHHHHATHRNNCISPSRAASSFQTFNSRLVGRARFFLLVGQKGRNWVSPKGKLGGACFCRVPNISSLSVWVFTRNFCEEEREWLPFISAGRGGHSST